MKVYFFKACLKVLKQSYHQELYESKIDFSKRQSVMCEELKTNIKVARARVFELEKNLQEMEVIHQMASDTFNAQYENRKAFLLTKLNVSVT